MTLPVMILSPANAAVENTSPAPAQNYMIADHKMNLHSNIARSLFNEGWHKGKVGLTQFAQLIKPIWQAAFHRDDPYAEWYLIKTYSAMEAASTRLESYEKILQSQLDSQRNFEFPLFQHAQPIKLPIRFATPFAHMGARLLEKVDYTNCLLYTLRRIGLSATGQISIRQIVKEIQSVYGLPLEWRNLNITRADVREQTKRALQAEQRFGVLPKAVLNQEIKISIFPKRREV